ncbi:hypothetical protein BH23VER1_BH23VER1_01470 [soil metagenome]
MGDRENRVFREILGRVSGFTGVGCVTFCLLGNHFHLLLEVRDEEQAELVRRAEGGEMDGEVCGRVGILNGKEAAAALGKELGELRSGGKDAEAWDRLEGLVARMGNLASFVKELKWRFSAWYNGEQGRVGTLWESRFRSVLVEGSEEALAATAAYIDLNPVRAGLAKDPKDYRFCGYAEAVGGKAQAREGLRRVVAGGEADLPEAEVLKRYRVLLFGRGMQRRNESGAVVRRGFSEEESQAVMEAGGALPLYEVLRCRVRYLTEGAAIGSREFLGRLLVGRREFFGRGRKVGGRKMRGGDWGGLCAVRDLRDPKPA